MAEVLFHGGPCDGTTQTVPDDLPATGQIACGGTDYTVYQVAEGEYLALLPDATPPPVYVPPPTGPTGPVGAPMPAGGAPGAWAGLMHVLGSDVPAATSHLRAAAARIAALRK